MSKDLTLEHLHGWAQRKGISVVGTGDFTHPRWFAELREKLVPAEDGLFALREDLIARVGLAEPAVSRETREAAELLATLAVPFGRDLAGFLEHLPLWQAGDLELAPQRVVLLLRRHILGGAATRVPSPLF